MSFLDKAIMWVSPQWGASRAKARMMLRHYESASFGRRTDGRSRSTTDANSAASGATLSILRAQARDLVRNNPWARRGINRIVGDTVGWGIRPRASGPSAERVMEAWKRWGETTECDADGQLDFYGLQDLVMRTIVESGEVLIRRRWRRISDGLAVPLQLQVIEPDLIDTTKDGIKGEAGGEIVQGVEFDAIGRRVAYWLFDSHPGGRGLSFSPASKRVSADGVLHVYKKERAGQVRGPSWFASVDVRLHDFDEFEDATLLKQKIAACMAAFVTDLDGAGGALGQPGTDSASGQPTDTFEPGMIIPLPAGKQVTVANPPQASDHQSFSATALRGVAAGLGTTYEDMTGDYSQVNYSSARMARLAHTVDVEGWRWKMLVPMFCAPVWRWMLDALELAGANVGQVPAEWSPPPAQLLDPDKEGLAYQRMVRNGAMTWPQMVRELGLDPAAQLAEIDAFNKAIDKLGIILDGDPRRMSGSGQLQSPPGSAAPPVAKSISPDNDATKSLDDTASAAAGESAET